MWTFDVDYIFINTFLFVVFFFSGIGISKGAPAKPYILLCTFIFMLVLGSRFMRGNDYVRYQETFLHDDDPEEIIFTFFNQFLRGIGFTKYTFLYVYSIPFAYCGLSFVSKYKKIAAWSFPSFLVAFILFDEFCIRQALGFSSIFLMLYELIKGNRKNEVRRWGKCALYIILACGIHLSNVLNVVLIFSIYFIFVKPITWKITIPLFIIAAFVISTSIDWTLFNNALLLVGGIGDKFQSYVDRSDQFFSDGAFETDYTRSLGGQITEAIGNSCLLYLGYIVIQKLKLRRDYIAIFNIYAIGAIFDRCFWNFELLRRIFDPMLAFWFFPLSFVAFHIKKKKFNTVQKVMAVIAIIYFYYNFFIKYLFERGEMTKFLWDM